MAEKWDVFELLLFRDGTSENAGSNLRVSGENFQGVAPVLIHGVRVFPGLILHEEPSEDMGADKLGKFYISAHIELPRDELNVLARLISAGTL